MSRFSFVILVSGAMYVGLQLQNSGGSTVHIEGIVLDGTTDKPLVDASVGEVITGQDGTFAIDLPILPLCKSVGGRCRTGPPMLIVTKQGFLPARTDGSKLPGTPGIPLAVDGGGGLDGLTVRLFPPGTITGRIFDSRGQPAQGVSLYTFRYFYDEAGTRTRHLFGSRDVAKSNDLGEFRIPNLDHGDYYLELRPDPLEVGQNQVFPAIFYPGSMEPSLGEAIRVERGAETRVKDTVLGPVTGGILSVRLIHEAGEPQRGATIVRVDRRNDWIASIRTVTVQRENMETVVQVGRLAPGNYDVRAEYASVNASSNEAIVPVTMGTSDMLVDLPIRKHAYGSVTGRAVVNTAGGEQPVAGVSLDLIEVFQAAMQTQSGSTVLGRLTSNDNGTFPTLPISGKAISYAGSGPVLRVRVGDIPRGMYVTSISDGLRNVMQDGLFVSPEKETNIAVRLATGTGIIEGSAVDSNGKQVPAALAVLVPDHPTQRSQMVTTISDLKGVFKLEGGPGSYHLYVWRELPGAAYLNDEFMEKYKNRGIPVRLEPNSRMALRTAILED